MCLNKDDIIGGAHYQIVKKLGEGGFGETYLAHDTHLPDRPPRLVKEITPSSDEPSVLEIVGERFNREAKALYNLGMHPQIPQLFESFQENGKFYLVQEFIEGNTLREELIPEKVFSEKDIVELLRSILEVLDFVHQEKVIHRDIKPSNLIRRKQDGKIFLIDFGAIKEIRGEAVTSPGQVSTTTSIGTRGYIAPEQDYGQPQLSSDVYAVGMIGIYAATGVNPSSGEIKRDANGEIIWHRWAKVSPRLKKILDKMVRHRVKDRYASAGEVLQDLRKLQPLDKKPLPRVKQWQQLVIWPVGILAVIGFIYVSVTSNKLSSDLMTVLPELEKQKKLVINEEAEAINNGLSPDDTVDYKNHLENLNNKVLKRNPDLLEARLFKAHLLGKMKKHEQKFLICDEIIKFKLDFDYARNCRGSALSDKGKILFTLAKKQVKNSTEFRKYITEASADYKDALNDFTKAITMVYESNQDLRESKQKCDRKTQETLKICDLAVFYYNKAEVLFYALELKGLVEKDFSKDEAKDEVIKYLEETLKLDPQSDEAQRLIEKVNNL
ncbi:MAG: serine/threonine protein kinase [Symploca sp. SIO2C1]|nr:serine/threonine protein kinase [Symploca sp. SIO2C1]